MTILSSRAFDDQPWVEATTALAGAGGGQDAIYIGSNDISLMYTTGKTATIDMSVNSATAPPPANLMSIRIESRATAAIHADPFAPPENQDGPSVRTAIHGLGVVYAAFFGWRTYSWAQLVTTDVVVVRDDNWGLNVAPFSALIDPIDNKAGLRVNGQIPVPIQYGMNLGTQRVGSNLAIAVDPTDVTAQTLYVAWANGTTGSNYTIHLRRSTNGGRTWTPDLRTIVSACNPGIAINSQGTVALLYQRLYSSGGADFWFSILEVSSDNFATLQTDYVLASTLDVVSPLGNWTIGDYANIVAVGKNFYGAFSADNYPDATNFPNGVTYQRNVDWVHHVLKDLNNNPVSRSVDPFFFQLTPQPADDFYVRDWTDNPGSGDTGVEPSTTTHFWDTCDVWNRRSLLPGAFPNDQPSNQAAGNGTGSIGDNWAFVRIRRNAPAAATDIPRLSRGVKVHFLFSKFGTGSNFVDSRSKHPGLTFPDPDPMVTFIAPDTGPAISDGYHWHLGAINSNRLSLAVEISARGDPYRPPSLVGSTPGLATGTDTRIQYDNNKAQRNLDLSSTPAEGVGGFKLPAPSFPPFRQWIYWVSYAIIHNGATFPRDMQLRVEAEPRVQKRLNEARIEIIGGRSKTFKSGDVITLSNMQPGENRWLGLTFNPPRGKEGEILPIRFYEIVGDAVMSGFTIAVRPSQMNDVIRDNLEFHQSAFTRMAAGFEIEKAREEAEVARKLHRKGSFADGDYMALLKSRLESIASSLRDLIRSQGTADPFGIGKALRELEASVRAGKPEGAAVAHTTLLSKLDSFLTMRQLSKGYVADILQNVRWQRDLYTKLPELARLKCSGDVREKSEEFMIAYSKREIGNKEFPELIHGLTECFRRTAQALEKKKLGLDKDIIDMTHNLGDLTALQKSHREYLLKLQSLAKSTPSERSSSRR